MGQKVHPTGYRLVVNKNWSSKWIAEAEYADFLHLDLKLRSELKNRLRHAAISAIKIERAANKLKINIHTARPGIIIGKKGQEVEKLKQWVAKHTKLDVAINIKEVKKPELDGQLGAESICNQLERIGEQARYRLSVEGFAAQVDRLTQPHVVDSSRVFRGHEPVIVG